MKKILCNSCTRCASSCLLGHDTSKPVTVCPDYFTPEDEDHAIWPNPIAIPNVKHYTAILAQAIKDCYFISEEYDTYDYIEQQLTKAGLTYDQAIYLMYHNTLNMEEI